MNYLINIKYSMNNTFNEIIENIAQNVSLSNNKNIKIVCDSGGFNGGYMLGCLLYLKNLENKQIIIVDKISGSSIGSLMALAYALDKLESIYPYIIKMTQSYKKNKNLYDWSKILQEYIDNNVQHSDLINLTEKLYINYYSFTSNSEIVINEYKTLHDLYLTIMYSTHLPFIIDGHIAHDNNIDNMSPFVFEERTLDDPKIIFIKLTTYSRLKKIFHIKGEINFNERITEGILDIHKFFKYKQNTSLCSCVNNWGLYDYVEFRTRNILIYCLFLILFILKKSSDLIPNILINSKIYSIFSNYSKKIYGDLFTLFYNS